MRKRRLIFILIVEAVACLLLYGTAAVQPQWFSAVFGFPFEQIGMGLRALSLCGGLGNGVAILLYLMLALAPVGWFLLLKRRRSREAEDGLLLVLSILLFVVLYWMVNPGLIPAYANLSHPEMGKSLLGGGIYAVLAGYGVLRLLRHFLLADRSKLQRYLVLLLWILAGFFVFLAFGDEFGAFLESIKSLQVGNQGNENLLGLSYGFLFLRYLVGVLSYILDTIVIFFGLNLIKALEIDRYSSDTLQAAQKFSGLCIRCLAAIVLTALAFDLLQIAVLGSLAQVSIIVFLPVLSIAFVLFSLLLARFIEENQRLKKDNDLFI